MFSTVVLFSHTVFEDVLPGFVEYSYNHILPACFIAPLESTFDLNDGYSFLVSLVVIMLWFFFYFFCFIQALGEIALLLKAFLDRGVRAALNVVCQLLFYRTFEGRKLRRRHHQKVIRDRSDNSAWSCDTSHMRLVDVYPWDQCGVPVMSGFEKRTSNFIQK